MFLVTLIYLHLNYRYFLNGNSEQNIRIICLKNRIIYYLAVEQNLNKLNDNFIT
jgi:hypothetical protein